MIKTENTAEKKENAADVCAAECAAEIKAGIRKQMRAMRRALDAEAVREASFAVAEKVRALPEFNSAGLLMAYMPAKNELDPMPLIECAKAAGKRIAFPLCIENGGLRLFVPNNGADSFVRAATAFLNRSRRIQPRSLRRISILLSFPPWHSQGNAEGWDRGADITTAC